MNEDFEMVVKTETGLSISVSGWDEGGAWLSILQRHFNFSTALTREEAQKLVAGLQAALGEKS
jgi:hypothetical protein|tara:strand:- start:1846 stop:2034 length:189 start_codon:yes stop_codon:yes gene_type:complete